ncbi:MAG: outer membrane lipoprotein-sorting protein [Bacteroidota bacterium]
MKFHIFTILIASLLISLGKVQAQTAVDIITKAEEVRRGATSSKAEMTMTIVRPTWSRTMAMKSWSKGDDYAIMLVTAPKRDLGTVTLKRVKEVWNWMPRIERTIKLPPSMMSQSWMGSDFTNDDLVREASLIKDYDLKVLGDSTIGDRVCWKIEMIPHDDAAVVWSKVYVWIDKKDYLTLRNEFYDEDDYLINVMIASKIKNLGGKTFATKLEMIPVEEEGHKTVIEYQDIVFDTGISENFFSVQNMKRVR